MAQLTKVLWHEPLARISTCPAGLQTVALIAGRQQQPDFDFNEALLRFALQTMKKTVLHLEHAKDSAEVRRKLRQGLAEFNLLATQVVEKDGADTSRMLDEAAGEIALALAGDVITREKLIEELEEPDRLNAIQARLLKTLFQIKAMKQMSGLDVPPVPTRQVSGPPGVIEQTIPGEQVPVGAPTGYQSRGGRAHGRAG